MDVNGERPVQFVRYLYHDVAGGHATVDLLESFDVLVDQAGKRFTGVATLETDLQG